MMLLFSSSSLFLKREEEDKEVEETLEMIALPLCLLLFVRVRALAVALVGGIDDDDNIFFSLNSVFLCHLLAGKRGSLNTSRKKSRPTGRPKFSFFVSLMIFSSASRCCLHHVA